MAFEKALFLFVLAIFLLSALASMIMLFYISRNHVKRLDLIALGHEVTGDNFAYLMLRVPNYTIALVWPYYAKRAGLSKFQTVLDREFKRPFMINMWLLIIGVCAFFIVLAMKNFILT